MPCITLCSGGSEDPITCIIATPDFMSADRRVTSDSGERSAMCKIVKNKWLITAAAGMAGSGLDLKTAVKKGLSDPAELVQFVDAESYALVLLPDGKRWRIEEGKLWPVASRETAAIGSGSDAALGWLKGHLSGRRSRTVTPLMVRKAQSFVASRRIDCGDGCDFRSF